MRFGASEEPGRRRPYHHGNLREALVETALALIAERGLAGLAFAEIARAVGVSPAAPYRHFRDRNALMAEIARRGFASLEQRLADALARAGRDPVSGVLGCGRAMLAYARREPASYAAMFETGFPDPREPAVREAAMAAFAVLRRAADGAVADAPAPRPPASMVALHVIALAHGVASLFVTAAGSRPELPMAPEELLEAGLLVYLQSLGLRADRR